MNKQEQIEKMAKIIDELYNVYDTTADEIAEGLYNAGYRKEQETAKEIERLKDDYAKLQELFAQYQMASDKEIIAQKKEAEKRFENNMKSVLDIEKKQAKIDVLNELKEKIHDTRLNDDTAEIIIEMIEELKKCQR